MEISLFTLRNLASCKEGRDSIAKEGGIKLIIGLLSNPLEKVVESATKALLKLAESEVIAKEIEKEGGIEALTGIQSSSNSSNKAKNLALRTLKQIKEHQESHKIIIDQEERSKKRREKTILHAAVSPQ